ncbi:MAG: porin [Rhizobiaceae bacterium]|nr:porin [Rhizobiaceae bacterium]
MKIKSLLLGSAAAIMAVSVAQAADPAAPVVEPELVEFVRICDAYGAGFFYIPGTETCLKFSGYVRVTYEGRQYHDGDPRAGLPTHRHRVRYRGRLNIDARNETEWGTLRSQLRLQGGSQGAAFSSEDVFSDNNPPTFRGSGDANVGIDRALISLAGFRLGYSSDYWETVGDSGYYLAVKDGLYGEGQAVFFDYTYAADGLTLTAGVQVAAAGSAGGAISGSGLAGQPDVYVGATYSGSLGSIFGTYYYDSNGFNQEGAGAWKAGASLNLTDYIPGGRIKAWYMADDGDTDYVKGHAWGISAKMDLTDNMVLYAGYSDWDRTDGDTAGNDVSDWSAGVRWKMARGLYSQFEYNKRQIAGSGSTGTYVIRVLRSF